MPRERHAVLAADLADIVAGPSAPGVSIAYGTVVAADSRTVDVRIGGSVVAGICMTTSCRGAAPGWASGGCVWNNERCTSSAWRPLSPGGRSSPENQPMVVPRWTQVLTRSPGHVSGLFQQE